MPDDEDRCEATWAPWVHMTPLQCVLERLEQYIQVIEDERERRPAEAALVDEIKRLPTRPADGVGPMALACDGGWGIEMVNEDDEQGPWTNEWVVRTDLGEGMTLAVFQFPDHAEAFVERCGPEGSSTEWRSQ